jgi:hypothetical protein
MLVSHEEHHKNFIEITRNKLGPGRITRGVSGLLGAKTASADQSLRRGRLMLLNTVGERVPLLSSLLQHALASWILRLCCQFSALRRLGAVTVR